MRAGRVREALDLLEHVLELAGDLLLDLDGTRTPEVRRDGDHGPLDARLELDRDRLHGGGARPDDADTQTSEVHAVFGPPAGV